MDPRGEDADPVDTIVACATAPGGSDRAVVRLSGPATRRVERTLTGPGPTPPDARARGAAIGTVTIDSRPCPAVLIRAVAPSSYTGEDTLECVLPGNPNLIERFIAACCAVEGVRRAGPGEFSARAYLNGRLALDEAEGIAAVIAARTREDLEGAQRLASGELGGAYRGWAEELATLLALIEAGIDFTDQEGVVPIRPAELRARLERVRSAMEARSAGAIAEGPGGVLPLVALLGPPNAGKSTLFNALLGRERSVVADESGTTRDVLIETLRLEGPGLSVRLADLPGLDAGGDTAAERAAQTVATETLARADAYLYCDPSGRFDSLAGAIPDAAPVLRVRTKADLPAAASGAGGAADGGGVWDVEVCALDGWRLDVLGRGIADIALGASGGSCAVALARHAREIARAAGSIGVVTSRIDPDAAALDEPEILADGLRLAIDSLGQVLGRITPDDVIGRVFATFCVGK